MFIKNFDEENKVLKNNDEKNNYNSISENQLILSTTKNNNENNNKNNENNNENQNNSKNNKIVNFLINFLLKFNDFTKIIFSNFFSYFTKYSIEPSYKFFLIFIILGAIFLLSCAMTLPIFLLSPSKFLFLFTLGDLFILFSFLFYYGSKEFINLFINNDNSRLIIVMLMCSTLIGFIISCYGHYFISLCFAIIQMILSIFFVLTIVPYGQYGINAMNNVLISPFKKIANVIKNHFEEIKNNNI